MGRFVDGPKIRAAWVVLTTACNNHCAHCYQSRSRHESMSTSHLEETLQVVAAAGCRDVVLLGGEPTLSPLLTHAVERVVALGMVPSLVTNGTRLTGGLASTLLVAGLARVTVSVEGDPALHDATTGRLGSFSEALAGIAECQQAGLKVQTMTTISLADGAPYLRMLELLSPLDVVSGFNFAVPSVHAKHGTTPDFRGWGRAARQILSSYERTRLSLTIPACTLEPVEDLIPLLAEGRIEVGCQVWTCGSIAVDADGNVLPCTHFDGYAVGSVEQGLDGLSDALLEVADAVATYPSAECGSCGLAGYCVGGCPLFRLDQDATTWELKGVEMDAMEVARRIHGERLSIRQSPIHRSLGRASGPGDRQDARAGDERACDTPTNEADGVSMRARVTAGPDCCDSIGQDFGCYW